MNYALKLDNVCKTYETSDFLLLIADKIIRLMCWLIIRKPPNESMLVLLLTMQRLMK